jgi:hypothetical protein
MKTRTKVTAAEGADYELLLQRLERIVDSAATKSFGPLNRKVLELFVSEAIMVYEGTKFLNESASHSTLHELTEPLARVIKILEHEANYDSVFVALGAPAMLALSPDQEAVKGAIMRYEYLLNDLHSIARAVPRRPAKRRRGKPPKANDLYALVDTLATYWQRATGKPFTQYWHNGSPAAAAAQFVHAVVSFIAPERVRSLRKVTERIVADRRSTSHK